MKKINAILLGFGMVGSDFYKDTYKRGVNYTGIFDVSPELIGKTAGEVIGENDADTMIRNIDLLPEFIKEHETDIAIITVAMPFSENALESTKLLLSSGINVLTSLADIYIMKHHYPDMYKELDDIAKKGNATFLASGIQDVFWSNLPVALSGCNLEISEIRGRNQALIDFFGPDVIKECLVGWNLEDFEAQKEELKKAAGVDFLIASYDICNALGLHPVNEKIDLMPIICKEDITYEHANISVKKGQLIGNYTESLVETEEGINIICEFVSKMTEAGDTDLNKWEIKGVPNINIITEHMQGEITTASNMVNRIPDVINAVPGVLSASEIGLPSFKAGDLSSYVK